MRTLSIVLLLASTGWSAAAGSLLDAVRTGDHQGIRELLRNHADVNATQPDGSTPLILAADRNDLEVVKLLTAAGARVNAANEYGATALFVACTRGNTAIIEVLLQAK